MADNPIKLVNENGRIVGKDPDTGDTVPVEFETLQTEDGTIGPATDDGDEPLKIKQDGSDPSFGITLAENDGWPDYRVHRQTATFNGVEDHTLKIGNNIDPLNAPAREDTNKPQFYDAWESSFDQGSYRFMERHFDGKFKDGTEFRLMGIKVRYADTDGNEDKSIAVSWPGIDTFSIADRVTGNQVVGLDISNSRLTLEENHDFLMDNDTSFSIKDTGGTYRPMLTLNSNDRVKVGSNAHNMNLNANSFIQIVPDRVSFGGGQIDDVKDGSSSTLGIAFNGGAGFYVNSSGEIVAVDEAGNETTLT